MNAVEELSSWVGVKQACEHLAIPSSSVYRRRRRRFSSLPVGALRSSARRLKDEEKSLILTCLHEERFQDCSPAQVYASLLDDGQYHCSIRTMYRLLEKEGENRERRDQLIHPPYRKPELLATGPNQLWSWDITKLRGPVKWSFYYLYVILDVFSRYVTGWMIAYRETAGLAKQLIEHSCEKQQIAAGQLTIHADRGSPMTAKPLLTSWPTSSVTSPLAFTRGVTCRITPVSTYCTVFTIGAPVVMVLWICAVGIGIALPTSSDAD